MKKAVLTLATIVGAIALVACSSTAQPRGMGQGQRGWGPGSPYGRIYDSQAVETISGVIVSIGTFSPDNGSSQGVHRVLKNDKETISVHLGPSLVYRESRTKIVSKRNDRDKGLSRHV